MWHDAKSHQQFRVRMGAFGIAAGSWIVAVCGYYLYQAFNLILLGILIFGALFVAGSAVYLRNARRMDLASSVTSEGRGK
jgi:hypothetical protein